MIEIEHAVKIYNKKSPPAVDDLSLEINNSEILGLVGLNGAGKTTTIRMIAGIILPTDGKIKVDGYDVVKDKVKATYNVGWIPELPNFEPNAKPLPLMRYFAGFYSNDDKEMNKRIHDLLDQVGLSEHLNKKLRDYSQGMKKRFAIAESLISDPKNVLFDETLNGLDPEGVKFVRNLILNLKAEGKGILLSSHILSEIENLADRVAIIHHGKLVKMLTRNELKNLGKTVVHIVIDKSSEDKEVSKILSSYGNIEKNDGELILTDINVDDEHIPEILEKLVVSGIKVRKFEPVGESLEEYFFKIIGEKQ